MNLIDSHCHLNYEYEPKSTEEVIAEAAAAGVVKLVTIGTEIATIAAVQAISEKHANVFHTVGVHPHEAVTIGEGDLARLEAAAKHPKCRAIGEIGLDYHYDHSPRDVQRKRFDDQLLIAARLALPVVIHSREGEEDLLASLSAYAPRSKSKYPGVIHCFSGTVEFGKKCLDLGFLISFSGIVTFKKADEIREAARTFPLERILVETDSPYLAPIPYRGKKCEPSMVKLTAQKIAEIRGISFDEVAEATTRNAEAFFGI
jgi:TatD DNase family protein